MQPGMHCGNQDVIPEQPVGELQERPLVIVLEIELVSIIRISTNTCIVVIDSHIA